MGGRGTYSVGNIVAYSFKTVGKINGIKILQPIGENKSFSMPVEAHSSSSYIVLDKAGVFRQYREYNSNHEPIFEIGYHFEKGLSKAGESVFHIHEYSSSGIENRQKGRLMQPDEIKKYKHLFKGVN